MKEDRVILVKLAIKEVCISLHFANKHCLHKHFYINNSTIFKIFDVI